MPTALDLTLIGGPTAVFTYGGLRWLTDPTFSPPGAYDNLTKTAGPAMAPEAIEPIDVVLLSHDQHADNLDPAGRAFLPRARRVLTEPDGAGRLGGNATGLQAWGSAEVQAADGSTVTVTAVPALHGPEGSESVTGPVTGFVLGGEGLPAVYVSGDNASLEVVSEIARRTGPVEIAILFAGAVQIQQILDGAYLTLSSDRAAQAALILGAKTVIAMHFADWTHFTQGSDQLRAAFAGHGITPRLRIPTRGEPLSVDA
jgi:L-ascorbate metabolism protein UlaG (beta-lactamase superfamily)